MKTISQVISWFLLALCLLLTQCSKTPDTPVIPKSSAKTLTNPTIDSMTSTSATLDAATSTYTVTVPFGTDVTILKLIFTLPTGATAKPASGSIQNFTNPVIYTITAEDGSMQTYTVKVVVMAAPKSSEKQIKSFTFSALSPFVSTSIDQSNHKIILTVIGETDVTVLVPLITVSEKATLTPASGVVQNFENTVVYTITAEDGSKQVYEIKVVIQTGKNTPVGLQDKSVRFIYMIPTDKAYNAEYEKAIGRAALHLQAWYKEKTGGYTFKLNNPIVEVYKGKQSSIWYSETKNQNDPAYYYWYNTFAEAPNFGMKYPDPNYTWVIYCDAQGGGAGSTGFAILPAEDLIGITGKHKEPVSRWVGGLGHEMGHAFSLPHPTVNNAIMLYGYIQYPDCTLIPEEIEILKKLPFFFKVQ